MKYLLLSFLFLFVFAKDANAYLDPGAGSYIFQAIIATALGTTYIFKEQVLKAFGLVKNLFFSLLKRNKSE